MESLKRSRGGFRAALLAVLRKLDDAVERKDTAAVEVSLAQLSEREAKVKVADEALIKEMISAKASEIELGDELTRCDDWFYDVISKRKLAENFIASDLNTSIASSVASPVKSSNQATVKLPKLEIRRYGGDLKDWQRFWGQFDAAVHSNPSLSSIQKFNYLQSLLMGIAETSIAGIALSDINYSIAVKRLQDRFGQKDLIIHSHMTQLLNLEAVRRGNDVVALRKLFDTCAEQIQSLEALGVSVNSYAALLSPVVMKLVPETILTEWNRQPRSRQFDFKDFMAFLQLEVEGRERSALMLNVGGPDKHVRPFNKPASTLSKDAFKPSSAALCTGVDAAESDVTVNLATPLPAVTERTSEGNTKLCAFCSSKDHPTWNCTSPGSIREMREAIRRSGACFQCFRSGHQAFRCYRRKCAQCNGRHHRWLCQRVGNAKPTNVLSENLDVKSKDTVVVQSVVEIPNTAKMSSVMKIVNCWLEGSNNLVQIRGVLDDGSQRSFIRRHVVDTLGLVSSHDEILTVKGFEGKETSQHKFPVVKVKCRNPHTKSFVCEVSLLVIDQIASVQDVKLGVKLHQILQERGLEQAVRYDWSFPSQQVDVLFGLDSYWRILTGDNLALSYGLMASESRFGWVINGILPEGCSGGIVDVQMMLAVVPTQEQWIHDCWSLDALKIPSKDIDDKLSGVEFQVQQQFEQGIKYVNGRYQVKLPWKDGTVRLQNNKTVAMQRLLKQVKLFKVDKNLFVRYQEAMKTYVVLGHAEPAKVDLGSELLYYLPHHPIIKEDRVTTKTRIVFDASSHVKGANSLNDCLNVGPNLNPDLLGLLLRFRKHDIALTADIEKAFLQVSLDPSDRDSTRFLWVPWEWRPEDKLEVVEYRMTCVLFGARPSPFLLAATIRNHLEQVKEIFPDTSKDINNNLYVDDYITGKNSVDEAYQLYQETRTIMDLAGMPMKKWMTNSSELHTRWLNEETKNDLTIQPLQTIQKVLGMLWDPSKDVFFLQCQGLEQIMSHCIGTKRLLLQASARIYDPFGLVSPVVIRIRQLFQESWKKQIPWDSPLDTVLQVAWEKTRKDLPLLASLQVPRRLDFESTLQNTQLHLFVDASEKAYGTVSYLRVQTQDAEIKVTFLVSKGRVAPLKALTLPRLELLGAMMGARLLHLLQLHLNLTVSTYLWTDSSIVLHWLQNKTLKLEPFVARRVEEINELSGSATWGHCPGNCNPADLVSRGAIVGKLLDSELWWSGPEWLSQDPSQWPTMFQDVKEEVVEEDAVVQMATSAEVSIQLFQLHRYSSLWRVLRVTCWIFRMVKRVKKRLKYKELELQEEEIEEATQYWIRQVQRTNFSADLWNEEKQDRRKRALPFGNLVVKADTNGILRVKGRLKEAVLEEHRRHPILLPGNSKFTRLVVMQHHLRLLHAGVVDTLVDLREKFWILRGRQVVKSVIHECLICKRFNCKPFVVEEAQLPYDRICQAPAFSHVGVDYAGPLYIRGEGINKAYILLMTCATTRAVHLELVSDLSTAKFLLAFRRFVSRRGLCKVIYSDNAKQFKKADLELKKLWARIRKSPDVQSFFGKHGIQWNFIVEKAAWWGGYWERLVRSVKSCLKRVLGQACVTFEELCTILAEVEAILNSRPLTAVYDDASDSTPLTPAHFLTGRRLVALPDGSSKFPVADCNQLACRWRYCQRLIGHFWKRWLSEYLLMLRSAHVQHHAFVKPPSIKAGDLVLLAEPKTARHLWPLARIVEVIPGRDKIIRSCTLIVKGSKTVIRRPVQLLCPLEISSDQSGAGSVND